MSDEAPSGTSPYHRRGFLKRAGLGAAAAGLAGCQGAPGGDGTQPGGNGTVEGDGRGFSRPFKLGMLTTESGLGESHTQAMRLAVDHLNADGGIGGADVEFVLGSTNGGPAQAKRSHRRLTRQENVDATFGALSIRALMPLIAESETLHFSTAAPGTFPAELVSRRVSPIDGDPEDEYETYKYHFRVGPINMADLRTAAIQLLSDRADDFGWDTVSVLVEQTEDSDQIADELRRDFEGDVGVEVPIAQSVSGSLSNWTPVFDQLEEEGTDLAFVTLVLGGTAYVNQWADQERDFETGGIHILSMLPDYWNETNGAVESVWTMNAMTPQTTNNPPHTGEFLTAFNERFDGYPLYAGPLAYDAIHIYRHAVEAIGSRDPEQLVPYLEEDLVYETGATIPGFQFRGPDVRFAHDPVWESIHDSGVPVFQQWQSDEGVSRPNVAGGGIMEAFAPEQNKSADYVRPPWLR